MTKPLIDSNTDIRNIYQQHPASVSDEFVKAAGWEKGLTAVEAGEEIGDGIAKGDWAKVALGGAGAGLDMLCAGTDPIGYVSGQLASWMMEHLEPLRKVLHGLTGEPEMIKAYAASWAHISEELGAVSAGYAAAAEGTGWVWGVTSRVGKVLLELKEAIDGLESLLAALRNMLDGVHGELSALAESKHAEVAS
jgi:hypothetical protein